MNVAIIVAAGRGTRMGERAGDIPKQFRLLAGVPLVHHTLRRFERAATIDHTILVVSSEHQAWIDAQNRGARLLKLKQIVTGGETRAESVRAALDSLASLEEVVSAKAEIVAVHDGARPFVSPAEIDLCVRAAGAHGAAILAAPVTDTIKRIADGRVTDTPPRSSLRRALTPQCFRTELLREAYAAEGWRDATDDSSLVERLGYEVRVLDGDERNIKITTPEDWIIAEELVKSAK